MAAERGTAMCGLNHGRNHLLQGGKRQGAEFHDIEERVYQDCFQATAVLLFALDTGGVGHGEDNAEVAVVVDALFHIT